MRSNIICYVQALVTEKTGNRTEMPKKYPPYWDLLLDCLGPFIGLNGAAVVDSESSLVTLCSAGSGHGCTAITDDDVITSDQTRGGEGEGSIPPIASGQKGASIFSPSKPVQPKRSKKEGEISMLTKSVSTLVDHIVVKKASDREPSESTAKTVVVVALSVVVVEKASADCMRDRVGPSSTSSVYFYYDY